MLLNRTGSSIFVERALGDSREDFNHRVGAVLLIHVGILNHVEAVREEASAEEFIDHDNVDDL